MVQSILVYPNAFVGPDQTDIGGGFELVGESSNEGEAWYRGPVVLSWPDALAGDHIFQAHVWAVAIAAAHPRDCAHHQNRNQLSHLDLSAGKLGALQRASDPF